MGIIERISAGGSSSISDFGYNLVTRRLDIDFTDGSSYTYSGVPISVYNGMLAAASKGGYFNANVRGAYSFIRR